MSHRHPVTAAGDDRFLSTEAAERRAASTNAVDGSLRSNDMHRASRLQSGARPALSQMSQFDNPRLEIHESGETAQLRILIVDDDADTARLMCRLLRKREYAVRSAATIRSAVEQVGLGPVDLLISDIALPDGSGLDLMRQLGAGRSLMGIAISGHGDDSDVAASLAAGFARHMMKPIDFDELLFEVQAQAQRAGLA
jgi:CheY-like chemotaxis protein